MLRCSLGSATMSKSRGCGAGKAGWSLQPSPRRPRCCRLPPRRQTTAALSIHSTNGSSILISPHQFVVALNKYAALNTNAALITWGDSTVVLKDAVGRGDTVLVGVCALYGDAVVGWGCSVQIFRTIADYLKHELLSGTRCVFEQGARYVHAINRHGSRFGHACASKRRKRGIPISSVNKAFVGAPSETVGNYTAANKSLRTHAPSQNVYLPPRSG